MKMGEGPDWARRSAMARKLTGLQVFSGVAATAWMMADPGSRAGGAGLGGDSFARRGFAISIGDGEKVDGAPGFLGRGGDGVDDGGSGLESGRGGTWREQFRARDFRNGGA